MSVPFSPALLAGMLLPSFATPLVAASSQAFASTLWKRHRKSFDRLADFEGCSFLIDPQDLPLQFHLELAPQGPNLKTFRKRGGEKVPDADAVIRGSIKALLDMAEGRVDGDALFFSRDLQFEGDTEAVVALRNAVDDADIDFMDELAKSFGPFSKPVFFLAEGSRQTAARMAQDFETLQTALVSPLTKRQGVHDEDLSALERKVNELEKALRKQAARLKVQEKRLRNVDA